MPCGSHRPRAAPDARWARVTTRDLGHRAVPQPRWQFRGGSANVEPTAGRREGRTSGDRRTGHGGAAGPSERRPPGVPRTARAGAKGQWPADPAHASRGQHHDRHSMRCEAPAGRSLGHRGQGTRGGGGASSPDGFTSTHGRLNTGSARLSREEGEGTPTSWLAGPMPPTLQPATSTQAHAAPPERGAESAEEPQSRDSDL